MFSDKRRTLYALAVLLAAIALAAVPEFSRIGNQQSNKCMGYNKTKPGRNQASLSTGSCSDTPSNPVTLFAANGKGGPIVDKKNKQCVTSASSKPGASVDGKLCKPVLKKPSEKRRRVDDEVNKDGDLPDFILNPEGYEWPPQQQWFKISDTSTEFSTSELWKNGYDLCLEVTAEGFFRQYKCDPNNPNQNWFINYEPQPEAPAAPETPVVAPPVVQPPVQPPGCTTRNCPSGQYQDQVTCECVCSQVTCPAGQVQDRESCACYCDPDLCGPDEIQLDDCSCERPTTCGAWNNCDNGWELADGAASTECLLRGSSDSIPRCENDWCCVRSLPPVNTTSCGAWNNCPAGQYTDELGQESSFFTIKNPDTLCTETGPFDQGVPKCNVKTCCSTNPMQTCGQWNKCSGANTSVPTEFAIRWCGTPSRPMDGFPDCSDDWCCAKTDYPYEPPVRCSKWNDCSVGWTLKTPTRQCTLPGYYLPDVPECNDNTCCAPSDGPVLGETTCGAWVGGDNICVDATGNVVGYIVDAQDSHKACRTQAPYDSTPQCTNNYCCVTSWHGTTAVGTDCSAWNRCSIGLVLIDSAASTRCTSITVDITRPMAAADSPHFPACNDELCCQEAIDTAPTVDPTPSHRPLDLILSATDPIPSATDPIPSAATDPIPSATDPIPSATDPIPSVNDFS